MKLAPWSLEKTERKPLTEDLANWYLQLPRLKDERGIREPHVTMLQEKLDKGWFLPETVILATVQVGKELFKLNGQHTCTALLQSKEGLHGDRLVTINYYACKTHEDAALLYAQLDPAVQGRTYSDLSRIYYGNLDNDSLQKIPARTINMIAAAMAFESSGWSEAGRKKIKMETRYTLPAKDEPATVALVRMAGKKVENFRHLRREAVFCAMLATFRKSQKDSLQFWGAVRDGTDLAESDPRLKLRDWLRTTAVANGRGGAKSRIAPFREMFARCIHGWNAFRTGQKTELRFYSDAELPKPV